jgi:hypothetical protein
LSKQVPFDYKPSTYVDIIKGNKTEKDVLINSCSEFCKKGTAPVLDRLATLMDQVEKQAIADHQYHTNGLTNLRHAIYQRMNVPENKAVVSQFVSTDFCKLAYDIDKPQYPLLAKAGSLTR